MWNWKSSLSLYPRPIGDPGRDRNARSLQHACFLGIAALATVGLLTLLSQDHGQLPATALSLLLLAGAAALNRAGKWQWAARMAVATVLLTAILLVVHAQDGFRSHATLLFPGLLLISMVLLDRSSYIMTALAALLSITGLGIADMYGLIGHLPPVRTPTNYSSVTSVDLMVLAIAFIGTLIADDTQRNIVDLRGRTDQLNAANLDLRQEEMRYRTLFFHSRDAIFLTDTSGGIEAANPAACQMLDMTEEQICRLGRKGIADESDPRLIRGLEERTLAGHAEAEVRMIRRDGSTFDAEVSSVVVTERGGAFVIARDITARKANEEKLRASEARFRAVVDNSHDGVYFADAAGRILYRSETNRRVTGFEHSERIGRDALALIHPDDAPAVREDWASLIRHPGSIREYEYRIPHKSGGWVWTAAVAHNLLDNPDVRAVVVNTRDITAQKQAAAEQERLRARLAQAQKLESIGRLAGGVAHDFNNLLTVINGQSSLLLSDPQVSRSLRLRLGDILKAGERAAGLTRQLLAFSRQQVLESRIIDLNSVVAGMRPMLEHLMGDDVAVVLDPDRQALPVFADFHQLEQVILNLAVNARDAMPRGGLVHVGTAAVKWDEAEAAAHVDGRPGPYAVLTVRDNGEGMNEATRQRIFEPFFTTRETGAGTGLGLSMVQGIVAQSGGYIDVDTKLGEGTTFSIYLPLRSGEGTSAASAHGVERAAGECETILVVEDRAEVRDYVVEVLKTSGYGVLEAADASEALRLAANTAAAIHLVLTDVVMPGISGIDLVKRLGGVKQGIKALFMSGYSDQNASLGALPDGSAFLSKPFSPAELVTKIQSVL